MIYVIKRIYAVGESCDLLQMSQTRSWVPMTLSEMGILIADTHTILHKTGTYIANIYDIAQLEVAYSYL